jgi:6-pyruvoyltetrahydropterin/6-carboxytetrahydropterin synthase
MYSLGLRRDLVARHYLIGGDWGSENELHPHDYRIEVRLEGESLNHHGFIVDLVDLESHLDRLIARYRDQTLNELPEFEELNPSLEHFARIFCEGLTAALEPTSLTAFQVTIWEDEAAWAAYRQEA